MSVIKDNLSTLPFRLKKGTTVLIVQSDYNAKITDALRESCEATLYEGGLNMKHLTIKKVPGAWELPIACQQQLNQKKYDVVIAIGLIIKGETPHFDFIASACAQGLMQVSLTQNVPIIFGVLTTNTLTQAQARIMGGKRGDKGVEIAQAALKILNH